MCLAVPAEVTEIVDDTRCIVSIGGVRQEVSTELLDAIRVGEFVIVHVGFALGRLDKDEAEATLALIAESRASAGVA